MTQSIAHKFFICLFFSWNCLCLPCRHPPNMQHRRHKNYHQHCTLLPRHNAPGQHWVLIKKQSRGSSQLLLQCLPTALPDLYSQLSVLITCIHRIVKSLFCPRVFGVPASVLLQEAALHARAGWWWGDLSQRSEWHYWCFKICNSKGVLSWIQKLEVVLFSQTFSIQSRLASVLFLTDFVLYFNF